MSKYVLQFFRRTCVYTCIEGTVTNFIIIWTATVKIDLKIYSKCQLTDFFRGRQIVQLQRLNDSCRL